jgi:RNA polymerase sigma-70 factor (ECF subfamily)
MGGCRNDAEEIAQDAYVALLKNWGKVHAYEDPEAWVRTVAIRKLISRHRRSSVQRVGLRRLVAQYEPAAEALSADGVDLARALAELPMKLRTVVLLHYVLDQSVEQISTQLSLPSGTVKSRLSRGRARLEPLLAVQEVFEA